MRMESTCIRLLLDMRHYGYMEKKLIWLGMFVGSSLGGYLPSLWGDSIFSLWSILLSAIGGFLGIWIGYRLSN